MRRILAVLLVVLAFVVPTFAQDEVGTIADIVVASAEGDMPEFTYLLAAVGGADVSILELLANPEVSLTVFAPTDAAFEALAEELGEEAFAEILANPDALTAILGYHVVDGAAMSADVVALLEENEGFLPLETLAGQYIEVAGNVEDGITVDQANLVLEMVDIEASNGVIHVIDAVLVPEFRTIAEVVVDAAADEEAPEFTALLAAVGAADAAVLELLSDVEADLTVFAPTDEAFAALGEETLATVLADVELLTAILSYHVVEGSVYSWDVVALLEENEGEFEAPMIDGNSVVVTVDEEGNVYINEAMIILTDIEAVNGVIHVIDAVLVPATE